MDQQPEPSFANIRCYDVIAHPEDPRMRKRFEEVKVGFSSDTLNIVKFFFFEKLFEN